MQQSVKAEVIYGQTDVYLRKSSCPTIKKIFLDTNIKYVYTITAHCLLHLKLFFAIKIQYIKTDTVYIIDCIFKI